MITGEIRNKVDKMWEYFWTGGLTNPIDVIEQLTYLMFMKRLDQEQQRKEKENSELDAILGGNSTDNYIFPEDKKHIRWSSMIQLGNSKKTFELMRDEAFEFIKTLDGNEDSAFSKYMKNAIFKVPTPAVLQNTMDVMEEIFNTKEMVEGKDTKGDLYEYLLSKLSQSGTNGQFRTPKHIINLMVAMMKPTPKDTIIDPACGTAGFLASSVEYLMKHHGKEIGSDHEVNEHFNNEMFSGNDTDSTMLGISAMNLILHEVASPNLNRIDSMSTEYEEEEKYSLVMANPPFKGSLDYDQVAPSLLNVAKTKKTELLFLSLIIRLLKIGGRSALIVPDGVLFGSSKAHKSIRKEIIENQKLEAVISMPSGVFKPYAGVSTGILVFTKTDDGGTDDVWFYDMTADGYSLDDKRNKIEDNDIPDIQKRWDNLEAEKERKRTEKSFFVPKEEIVSNDYDLSLNRYKEIVHEEVEYEAPQIILNNIKTLEEDIRKGIQELEKILGV